LAYAGSDAGVCAAGGQHDHSGSGAYVVGFETESAGQTGWRWCSRCQGLAYAGSDAGVCAAGGQHDHSGSGAYVVAFEAPGAAASAPGAAALAPGAAPRISAIIYWPPTDEAYFFRGRQCVRYGMSGPEGARERIADPWRLWPVTTPLDAAATVQPLDTIYLFSGDRVVEYLISQDRAVAEAAIADMFPGLPAGYDRDLDAVVYWPPNRRMYFFQGSQYVRYNLADRVTEAGPQDIATYWKGLTLPAIDDVVVGSRGKAYFFHGDQYVTYSVVAQGDHALHAPRPWRGRWPGLADQLASLDEPSPAEPPVDPVRTRMQVGVNYPWAWNAVGLYFGGGDPPGSQPSWDRWLSDLRGNLRDLKAIGVMHVRIFLLCNAFNYGSVAATPPPLDPNGETVHTPGRDRFTPPATLHPKYVDHLKGMLSAFRDEEMFVLPSLLSFDAFHPSSATGCGGRTQIATDAGLRSLFLTQVLDRLLAEARPYAPWIYVWEVVNEPVWDYSDVQAEFFFERKHGARKGGADVRPHEMQAFLADALARIKQAGFASTVGHRYYSDLTDMPTGDIRQFHYYPKTFLGVHLPFTDPHPLPTYAQSQAIIGEFSCHPQHDETDPWPELGGADKPDIATAVAERLHLLDTKGYRLVFLWPDLTGRSAPLPDFLKLSPAAQDGVRRYLTSR